MTNKERRKHCASGARTMMSLNAEKRRGRPPKVKPKDEKEESKTVSEIESEFDYRCKSANQRQSLTTRRMTRFQLKSQKRDNSLEYKIISSSSETSDDDVIENLICNEEKEIKKIS